VRVPATVVVTLVGIALTAWLLPAFTRQWDDRQKERQLKAEIVKEMASATSRALVGGEAIWNVPTAATPERLLDPNPDLQLPTPPVAKRRSVNGSQVADDWARASLAIEAQVASLLPRASRDCLADRGLPRPGPGPALLGQSGSHGWSCRGLRLAVFAGRCTGRLELRIRTSVAPVGRL